MKPDLFPKALMTDAPIDVQICDVSYARLHRHEFFEFVYVLDGSAEHTINGHTMIISKGDYFLIDMNGSHSYTALTEDFSLLNCLFLPEALGSHLSGARSITDLATGLYTGRRGALISVEDTCFSRQDPDGRLAPLCNRLSEERRARLPLSSEIERGILCVLVLSYIREVFLGERVGSERVSVIKEAVAREFSRDITLGEIAREMGVSLTYASLIFKEETGQSFRDYLVKYRIEKACDLLRRTDRTVADIAAEVGYSDTAFFYRAFKKHLGVSPREYRLTRS